MELIKVGDKMAEQSAGVVNLLEKLHATLEKASPADRASIYDRAKTAKKVFTDLAEAIEAWVLNTPGAEISGYKIAPGNGKREWEKEAKEVASALAESFGVSKDDFYQLKSPSEIEKMLGNKMAAKNAVAKLTKVEEGKLGVRPVK